jgi:hypothetical protein
MFKPCHIDFIITDCPGCTGFNRNSGKEVITRWEDCESGKLSPRYDPEYRPRTQAEKDEDAGCDEYHRRQEQRDIVEEMNEQVQLELERDKE